MKKALNISAIALILLVIIICVLFGYSDKSVEDLKSKYAQAPSEFVRIDGMDVHFRDEGNSQDSIPIVLIHGTGSSLHTFDEWTSTLKKDRRVLRMDLPAFGLTGPFPNRDYSIEHYVDFLDSFLISQEINRCILVGNSLGGQIAWRYTLVHSEIVDQLILIDAAGYPKNSSSVPIAFKLARIPILNKILTYITPRFVVKSSVENVYFDKSKITEELIDRYLDLSLRTGNRQALIDRMKTTYDTNYVEEIKTIQQPTLVLWGEADSLITISSAYRFHDALPNDTLVILKNCGHVPMEELPQESLNVVQGFLKESDPKQFH